MASSQTTSGAGKYRWGLLVAAAGMVGAILLTAWFHHVKNSAPLVTRPPADPSLDPQVRAYLSEWVNRVEMDPGSTTNRIALGLAYAANGLWAEARATFLTVASHDPKEPLAALYAAIALQELSDDSGAWREFSLVASNFPSFAPAWYRVGETGLRRGELPMAEMAFSQLIRLAPNEWRGPAGLGEVSYRKGQLREALPHLQNAVRLDAGARPAHYLLGMVFRNLGRTNEAALELALGGNENRLPMPDPWSESAPSHMRLLSDQLAQAEELSLQGQSEMAVNLLRHALPYHRGQPALLNQLAIVLNRAGHSEEAYQVANEALEINPGWLAARITRAMIQARRGQFDAGLADAHEALRRDPGLVQAHLAIAELYLAQENDREAVSALEAASRLNPKSAEIHVELGDIYWHNLKEKSLALAQFSRAIDVNPGLAKAYERLGQMQVDLGERRSAHETLRRLIYVAPNSPERLELEAALDSK